MLINFKYHCFIVSSIILSCFSLSCEKKQTEQYNQFANSDTTEAFSNYELENHGINEDIDIHFREPYCPLDNKGYITIRPDLQSEYAYHWGHTDSMTNHLDDLEEGHYTVTITDTSDNYAIVTIHLYSQYKTCINNIPNSFSPNGDGINDTWGIRKLIIYYPNCKVTIYNEYGKTLFVSYGYNNPWDGCYKRRPLEAGDYYYTIDLYNDGSEVIEGVVTIIQYEE